MDQWIDVHGELDALKQLFNVMGYSNAGVHPEGRKLVFVGDLTDRGPDSPRVIDFFDQPITQELGYCVLGNHDLNLLLDEKNTSTAGSSVMSSNTRISLSRKL